MRKLLFLLILFFGNSIAFSSDQGVVGIIDMPSARMNKDGTFTSNISKEELVDTYSINYQASPWLETGFKYAAFQKMERFDRSYELKIKILNESNQLPAVSVGLRDFLGTGIYSSEYIVGSKKLYNLDYSLGLGWGRMSSSKISDNPLSILSDDYKSRSLNVGKGGTPSINTFFKGPYVGLFGGIIYDIENYPIELLLEYNADKSLFA